MTRPVVFSTWPCTICGEPIAAESVTSPTPGAPEMLRLEEGAWFGYVALGEGKGADLQMVVACREACAQKLLKE